MRVPERLRNLPRPLLHSLGRLLANEPTEREARDALGGKTVLITGASRGVGARVAAACGDTGAHVLLVARTRERLEKIANVIRGRGGQATVYPCDLSDADATSSLIAAVLQDHDRVDVLINNAGHSIRRSVVESLDGAEDAERLIELNYLAAVRLMAAFAPGMAEHGDGHIVQISSVGTLLHHPRFAAYLASKMALEEYGRVLAGELHHQGVDVTVVHLPLVSTAMIAPTEAYRALPRFTPDQAAGFVLRALVSRPMTLSLGLRTPLHLIDGVAPSLLRRAGSLVTRYEAT